MKTLKKIQKELNCPKNQFNKFGGYSYRNQEDILEAVKPLLGDAILIVSDEIVEIGGRIYVKATATFVEGEDQVYTNAFAREPEQQKGMSDSQITGSASSYARKYALNGLFLIDDVKDADSTNTHGKEEPRQLSMNGKSWASEINALNTLDELTSFYKANKATIDTKKEVLDLLTKRKLELQ